MIQAISDLKKSHSRMTTVLKELEVLEDGQDFDYYGLVVDYRDMVHILENRRESLQKRGRRL